MSQLPAAEPHTTAWMAQVWLSFLVASGAMGIGILFIPVDLWIRGYLAMGTLFLVGSTVSLTKTLRDSHEARRVSQVIRDARLEKILAEQDPLK